MLKINALLMAVSITIENNKYTLKQVFNTLKFKTFPITFPINVYVALTNGRGEAPIEVSLVDVDDEFPPLFVIADEISFDSPLETQEHDYSSKVQFSQPGIYTLRVASRGEILLERRLTVTEVPK